MSAHGTADEKPPRILAAVVLYCMRPQTSPALQSLITLLAATPAFAEHIRLFVWDNSPTAGQSEPAASYEYHHDPANPGLHAAYTAALDLAATSGCHWLMLLDGDTTVTSGYLREVLTASADLAEEQGSVAALVPRLMHNGNVVSPFRPTAQGPVKPLATSLHGIAMTPLQAFNSGAVFRVRALQHMGGFDPAFPLEYLDHATFAGLQRAGGRVYVLCASLQHDLSTQAQGPLGDAALDRQRNILAAERRFVSRYGTAQERRLSPVRTMRHALSVLWHKRDLRHAILILRSALSRPS